MGINIVRSAPRYSSILVHAGGRLDDDGLTRDAVFMANAFGARLVGVSTPSVKAVDLTAAEEEAVRILMEADGDRFKAAASQVHAGVVWRKAATTPVRALLGFAWAADLLMVDLQGRSENGARAAELEAILKKSQRAVLVRTHSDCRLALKRALILWDQSAACCRAVASALPLLSKAQHVLVLPVKQSYLTSATQALSDLEQGLRVRDLPVQVVHERACDSDKTADDFVRSFKPDILVMSARNRWGAGSIADRLQRHETYAMVSL